MKSYILRASQRGGADYGWLNANYYFSFANYYNPGYIHFGALRVINDDVIAGGMGFGTHPHDNMEIITIPLHGALAHKDSMGHEEVIYPGEVQVMSAGTGIQHSEYNYLKDDKTGLFQIWIFPRHKGVAPRYEQKKFDENQRSNKWQSLVGPTNENGALTIYQDAWICRGVFDAGSKVTYDCKNPNNGIYMIVVDGEIDVTQGKLEKRDALALYENSVSFTCSQKTDVLLIDVPKQW